MKKFNLINAYEFEDSYVSVMISSLLDFQKQEMISNRNLRGITLSLQYLVNSVGKYACWALHL